ncbi:MAG: hypothetical protein KAT28_01560 [Candidatus Aenigmarchaeota archaeon]|nr:hypothetical protein [Candidatus Aenigmarchaeota archaeon]
MVNKPENPKEFGELLEFLFVSILFFGGFCVLYISKVTLNSLTSLQAKFLEIFVLGVLENSIFEVIINTFSGIFIALLGFTMFCLGLSFLAVKKPSKIKYFLVAPILCSGILFNFSTMFLFLAMGLFLASLYVIPLGETYQQELKKWKKFRIGSNAVSHALLVMFIFIFIGSLVSFYTDDSYSQNYMTATAESLSNIIWGEISNFAPGGDSKLSEEIINRTIKEQMQKLREEYPDFTEEQYSQIEVELRDNIIEKANSFEVSDLGFNITETVSNEIENSPLIKSLLIWFPIMMSITIWVSLEFFKSFLFAPVAGIFSYILFSISEVKSNKGSEIETLKELNG